MHKQHGFTLIEMMLALAIFSLLSLMGYQILQGVMRNGELTRQHVTRLEEMQRLFSLLDRDISQAMIPAWDATISLPRPGFICAKPEALLQLTRRNGTLPGSPSARSTLQTIRWRLVNNELIRETVDDRIITARFREIEQVTLRYWSAGRWSQQWSATLSLPEAIEVSLSIADYGKLTRVIMLSGVK
ncbi:type II secretion system minor pseudopilin GspJ [Erwinia pyrifoliae]|uniref:Type II secretion system protein J n=1 Tax=Erwinia pyrifoliae TaxID=79967 RepID=A0ABY5X5V5_ERWPY|nr:type II secretion system minor pseudopilin GspJ [Erwinia pyrifoliae]AUX73664.1 type II secretion system protein GspJ [Erwinia pyrifoliae]MCA8876025.1 type II secretion system protein GspJ [Erwinia pyrifoliae]UWS32775.1 type II secretion system minor pseudopilin GspJ [Erwinia pyrifoliae]UXK11624.1 type II secretion system minor pseudopilin GspJ [Erwinia pyrifoliae]CAX54542.1 General secretion pathway protein J [Erwinia pyrifoliae Ep1/96]